MLPYSMATVSVNSMLPLWCWFRFRFRCVSYNCNTTGFAQQGCSERWRWMNQDPLLLTEVWILTAPRWSWNHVIGGSHRLHCPDPRSYSIARRLLFYDACPAALNYLSWGEYTVGCTRACGHLQNESTYYVKYQGCNFCPGSSGGGCMWSSFVMEVTWRQANTKA